MKTASKIWKSLYYLDQSTDVNVQVIHALDESLVAFFKHICFGHTVAPERKDTIFNWNSKNPNNPATYLDVIMVDELSYKIGTSQRSDEYIELFRQEGLFRNCIVERVKPSNKILHKETKKIFGHFPTTKKDFIRIRFNINSIKAQEIWIVGWVMRHLNIHPKCILNFLKLTKLHPEKDLLQTLIASFSVWVYHPQTAHTGHSLSDRRYVHFVKGSIKELQEELDKPYYLNFLKSNSYNIVNGLAAALTKHVDTLSDRSRDDRFAFTSRSNCLRYTPEMFESFFDIKVFKKIFKPRK